MKTKSIKVTAVVLAVIGIVSLMILAFAKSDSENLGIKISSVRAAADSDFTVDISLENNSAGISLLEFDIKYNSSAMSLVSVSFNETEMGGINVNSENIDADPYHISWIKAGTTAGDIKIASLKFHTSGNFDGKNSGINIEKLLCFRSTKDAGDQKLNPIITAGYVYLSSAGETKYGDATGDSTVDMNDIVLLRQYIANFDYDTGASTVPVGAGADANGDGNVDMNDIVLLRQYIANYDYDTGTSSIVLGPSKTAN